MPILFLVPNRLKELPEVNVQIFKFLSCYRLNELPDVHFCVSFMLIGKLSMALACENIRFSSLFIAGDVSRGGTSATRQQKFHTDDVKSVRNPVRGADWSMEQLHCFSYCLQMTGKRQKATKVKCKCKESLTKQSIFVEYSLLQKKHLSFVGARWQMNTTLHRNPPKDKQNWTKLYLEPHDYRIYYVSLH